MAPLGGTAGFLRTALPAFIQDATPMKFHRLPPSDVRARIPRTVWALGFVSLFMDISSEMIHAVLPLFMASIGATSTAIGFTEGAAESVALIMKVFSGMISDRFGHTKLLAFAGYALGVLSKPFFALSDTVLQVFCCRFADRIGKGIRGAPRDALIADVTPKEVLGASFGLRQSLDSAGAFIGPLVATLVMAATFDSYRTVFWAALVPGLICLSLILFEIKAPDRPASSRVNPLKKESLRMLSGSFWLLIGTAAIFSLARFSNAFIVLRAADCGISPALVPLVMVVMNLAFAGSSYPFGKLADKFPPVILLEAGICVLFLSDLVFSEATGPAAVIAAVVLWGIHLGATQGIFSLFVAKLAPAKLRGTAFGLYNLSSGVAALAAGVFAGVIWDVFGPSATFLAGGAFAVLAALFMGLLARGPLKNA